jgi:ribosomal protein S18 acetylase RimI-like enzyme
VPTKKCIEEAKKLISDEVDLIVIPHKYYSFGVHNKASPWSVSGQLRLFNRKRVEFTGIAHAPIKAERFVRLHPAEDCYVLHQTHTTAESFMRAHCDYMINEGNNGTPQEVTNRAMQMFGFFDKGFTENKDMQGQEFGWKLYWLGVAMHAWFRDNPGIGQQYQKRALDHLNEHWL